VRPLPDAKQGLVTVAAASPDDKLLATGGADGTIVLWNAPELKERMKRR
jgi:WD40 repeat protein